MLVKIRFDSLIFVKLSPEQVRTVEYHADRCRILKDLNGGVQVNGKQGDLFQLLFNLSLIYDIELM